MARGLVVWCLAHDPMIISSIIQLLGTWHLQYHQIQQEPCLCEAKGVIRRAMSNSISDPGGVPYNFDTNHLKLLHRFLERSESDFTGKVCYSIPEIY